MKVEIYFDVVCPWCHVGERRFMRALEAMPGSADGVEVAFRPFQLDPDAPTVPMPIGEYLERRYGALSPSMQSRVGKVAEGEGIRIDWSRALMANTLRAHRLVSLAQREYSPAVQRALVEALFSAHFERGLDVGDQATLTQLAADAGMEATRVAQYLMSAEGEEETLAELAHARAIGVQSVPTFVFDGKWAVEGAQSVETFVQVLEEVRQRSAETAGAAAEEA